MYSLQFSKGDFGISMIEENSQSEYVGTIQWRAPEATVKNFTTKADVYRWEDFIHSFYIHTKVSKSYGMLLWGLCCILWGRVLTCHRIGVTRRSMEGQIIFRSKSCCQKGRETKHTTLLSNNFQRSHKWWTSSKSLYWPTAQNVGIKIPAIDLHLNRYVALWRNIWRKVNTFHYFS